MKLLSYSCILLSILSHFSIIKTGVSLRCYAFGIECMTKESNANERLDCIRSKKNEVKGKQEGQCPSNATSCVKVNIKTASGEQLLALAGCGFVREVCHNLSSQLPIELGDVQVECKTCESDSCNGATPGHQETPNGESPFQKTYSLASSIAPVAMGMLIFNLLVYFLL